MSFVFPEDQQIMDLYKAVSVILRLEGVTVPSDEEAAEFVAHYGTLARLTSGGILALVHRFHSNHVAAAAAEPPVAPTA